MIRPLAERRQLVERQIESRGVSDPAVLAAFESVPREAFLPPELGEFAYLDRALPIEKGQTISQPYIVAVMTEALKLQPQDRVLEVGTGSGYAAAILGKIAREVYSIERHAELAEQAARRLREQGFDNVHVLHGDGTLGRRSMLRSMPSSWPQVGRRCRRPCSSNWLSAGGLSSRSVKKKRFSACCGSPEPARMTTATSSSATCSSCR